MPTVAFEGWRFLPHSYALIAQYLALELLERPGFTVWFTDAPLADARWRAARGVLSPEQEARLAAIPAPPPEGAPDLLVRVVFPYDFSPSRAGRTVVVGSSEYGIVPGTFVAGGEAIAKAAAIGHLIATPSAWSREGFLRSGVKAKQVWVVPNGVDTDVFAPAEPARREAIRRRLGWEGRFVLLHNSSLGWNKGVEIMLEGLNRLIDETPGLTLVIKGNDALYDSKRVVESLRGQIGPEACARLLPHVIYLGESMAMREVAELYQGADAYVCPYLAEGFNMPALEAVACGTPVLCTAGGPTDEFTNAECALRIASRVQTHAANGGRVLSPSFESYVGQVRRVVRDGALRARAREAGPALARAKWTWRHAADALLAVAGLAAT